MPVETLLKHESRRFQPEAWSGPPLLSRPSRAFAKWSGRRRLPERRFLMEALLWAILPCPRGGLQRPSTNALGQMIDRF